MKYAAIVSLLFMMACAGGSQVSQENQAIVEKYVDAIESNDPAAMEALLADSYWGYGPSVGDSINKAGAIESWQANMETVYEDIEYTQSQVLAVSVPDGPAKGDWVSNWAYLTITYKDGRGPVNLWVNAVYKIENGKIARSRTFYNEADVMAQLGYRVFPPLTVPEGIETSN